MQWTYGYDARDELTGISQTDTSSGSPVTTTVGQYRYDADGLRTDRQSTATGSEHYTWDDHSLLLTFDDAGTYKARYRYGPKRLESLTTGSGASALQSWYFFDALGSVTDVLGNSGSLDASYRYDAWGRQTVATGASVNQFGFTGHQRDAESGLSYFKARFYDPDVGRFLTEDSYEGRQDTPPSLHRYLYAYDNPEVYWDADGHNSVTKDLENAEDNAKSAWGAYGYRLLRYAYQTGTLGFASIHDPKRDQYDAGKVTYKQYWVQGVGGGLAVVGAGALTGGAGGLALRGATTVGARLVGGAAVGAAVGASNDAATQGVRIASGDQAHYNVKETAEAAATGAAVGGALSSVAEGAAAVKGRIDATQAANEGETLANRARDSVVVHEDPGSAGSTGAVMGDDPAATSVIRTQEVSARDASSSTAQNAVGQNSTRPTWRQSEVDVGNDLGDSFDDQVSYLNGKVVPHGTPDSVRPDFVANDESMSVEVKNYNVSTNQNGLINSISRQALKRAQHLPAGMEQQIVIDVRGQFISEENEIEIIGGIFSKSRGVISPSSVLFKK